MKELKLALEKFESVNSSLVKILTSFDTKNIILSQEELMDLREKNKNLEKARSESIKKINKILTRIEQILKEK